MKYSNPPIKEAVFDIRVEGVSSEFLKNIEESHNLFKANYPKKRKKVDFIGKFDFNDGPQALNPIEPKLIGYIFSTLDGTRQVQFRINGFTFNMLKPYTDWNDFSSEALKLWEIYKHIIKPNNLSRIALRYINRIELPFPFEKFQDYLIYLPPIPKSLPQKFGNFFLQMTIPCDNEETYITINETIEPPSGTYLPFLLDLDIYQLGNFSDSIESLKEKFLKLHDLKNGVFEDCITNKTRQLFE
jgi:uncharacterized protein (TIGR04255 family)